MREGLLSLVEHRQHFELARVRRLLAPRSVAVAGFGVAGLAAALLAMPSMRAELRRRISKREAAIAGFIFLQCIVAGAVVLNVNWYYLRQYKKPVWSTSHDEVLAYTLPQAWRDSERIRREVKPEARIAFRAPEGHLYWLPSQTYPIQYYDAYPKTTDWMADRDFAALVLKKKLTHMLDYDTNKFELRPLK